jgi:hypothetical protein
MSSSRSNAAARQRRAGGNDIAPQRQQGPPQQMPPPPVNNRLSIPDAIGLITLRLGRLENIVEDISLGGGENGVVGGGVDENIIRNIMERLDALEKQRLNASPFAPAPNSQSVPTEQSGDLSELEEKVEFLLLENQQIKDHLLQLQSFSMETNQKLVDIVLNDGANKESDRGVSELDNEHLETLNLKELVEQELLASSVNVNSNESSELTTNA